MYRMLTNPQEMNYGGGSSNRNSGKLNTGQKTHINIIVLFLKHMS